MITLRLVKIRQVVARGSCVTFSLLLAASAAAQQPSNDIVKPSPSSTGTISGRVFDSSGQPLTNAIAYVAALGSPVPPRGVVVDNEGAFKLEGLEAGAYSVWASAPGFVTDSPTLSRDSPRKYYRPGDSVDVALTKGGVITGTVTTATGQPVVAVVIHALRTKDAEGKAVEGISQPRDRLTDDRGVYRIYGLPPGTYVISAGGPGAFFSGIIGPYDNDVPTYAPSSTRDSAAEVIVRSGDEATGVNIQYRGEAGRAIGGVVIGGQSRSEMASTFVYGVSVTLTDVLTRTTLMYSSATSFNGYTFEFNGVPDGEYELNAQRSVPSSEMTASEPQRVKVRGADLTGLKLTLAPLGSIAGQLSVEGHPELNCARRRATALPETVITVRRDTRPEAKERTAATAEKVPLNLSNASAESVSNEKGEFTLNGLRSGLYRIEPSPPGSGWYFKSVTWNQRQAPATNMARDGITLKTGERLSGVTLTITEGGASLRGRVSVTEGQRLPPNLRVDLIPAEQESAENVLRFFETRADSDGSFAIGNIAPGRYWIIERTVDESDSTTAKSLRQDALLRSQLLKAAATRKEIQFQPCQRLLDYELPYGPAFVETKSKP